MADTKRWTATYTKHVKQKRKVYQDGFLKLHVSSGKVMLYDEFDKLLVCRILKKEENVASGETLDFGSYLVDIGDLEGGKKPETNLDVYRKHKSGSRFRTPSFNGVDMNAKEKIPPPRKPLSPSQKIIKEFKRREMLKYASPKISQETTKPSTSEWQVLYTNQMTQKAKKYHDGFLQLVISGSQGAQVRLFDATRKLLGSRFLKKDDVIKPGESVTFDAYLVDIGEDPGSHTPDSSVQRDNCIDVERMDTRKTSVDTETHGAGGKCEWQVLYTTQITQKAKKYHDGFLQLEFCGSLGRQIALFDLSKRPLERRFLKKDEVIRAGESVYFDGHLVDVGELEGSHQSPVKFNERGTGHNVERRQPRHGQKDCHKVYSSSVKGQPPSKPFLLQDPSLNSQFAEIEEITSNTAVKPLRDGQPPSRPFLLQDPGLNSQFAKIEEIKSNKAAQLVKPLRDGQPPRRPFLRQDPGLDSQFGKIEDIKSNKAGQLVKPLRDVNQILALLQDPKSLESYVTGGRVPNGPCQNITDRESTKAMKPLNITSTEDVRSSFILLKLGAAAACGGTSSQPKENVKTSHQCCSHKEAQTNTSEANFDLLLSSSASQSPCLLSNKGKSAEDFLHERELLPSFDLGF